MIIGRVTVFQPLYYLYNDGQCRIPSVASNEHHHRVVKTICQNTTLQPPVGRVGEKNCQWSDNSAWVVGSAYYGLSFLAVVVVLVLVLKRQATRNHKSLFLVCVRWEGEKILLCSEKCPSCYLRIRRIVTTQHYRRITAAGW